MKKIISLLLAVAMLFGLVACGSSTPSGKPKGETTPAVQTPKETPKQSNVPETPAGDPSDNYNEVGFFTTGVDPFSRKTYNIVFSYMRPMSLMQQTYDNLVELEPILNFKTTAYNANSDIDALIQNIQLFADQGVDGFIIVIDATAKERIVQVLDETGLPYIAYLNSVRDENGSELVPVVALEGVQAGQTIVQWMYDNYKTYWGEIDESKIGMLNFNYSPNTDFNDRYEGAKSKFLELLPGNAHLMFDADGVSGGLNEQTGYDLTTATLSAHPEVGYWFIPCCLEQYAQGAARAVETLGMEDRVMIVDISGDILPREWDSGYEGCWVASYAVPALVYAVPAVCGLISLLDGTSTPETLWAKDRAEGDICTSFNPIGAMIDIHTYKDFFASIREKSGLSSVG